MNTVDNKKSVYLVSNILYLIIIIFSLLYFDEYGIVTLIGGFAILSIYGNIKSEVIAEKCVIKRDKKNIILFWTSVLGAFAVMFLYYFTEWEFTVKIGNTIFVPSLWFLYYYIIPIAYMFIEKKVGKSKKNILPGILVCSFLIIKSIFRIAINFDSIISYSKISEDIFNIYQIFLWAAVMEELFFRAYLYDFAEKIYGSKIAVILSSVFFLLIHFNLIDKLIEVNYASIINFLAIGFLGILMAVLYKKTRSILWCIIFHLVTDDLFTNIVILIHKI